MKLEVTETDRLKYREEGYHIFPQVLPHTLLTDLRREAAKLQEIAYRERGPQAQRISKPINAYAEEIDLSPFRRVNEIDGLNEAIKALLTDDHYLKSTEEATVLFGPNDRPWSTEWHRDWRDHIEDKYFYEHIGNEKWEEIATDFNMWNQVNCPLYEDTSTWYVPGSFRRVHNTEEEMRVYSSTNQEELRDESNEKSDEEVELFCLRYCQTMPGAVQLVLNPGDFCIYRNVGWHLGNYVTYRKRMTLHTHCHTEAFAEFGRQYSHLLDARAASLERHAKLVSAS